MRYWQAGARDDPVATRPAWFARSTRYWSSATRTSSFWGRRHPLVCVRPPLHDGTHYEHVPAPPGAGPAIVVSYLARDENDKAARWIVEEVWPAVASRVPGARLRLVGGGATDALRHAVEGDERVELVGFVDDLADEYAGAAVALVPVLQGAGVKFKTIEALLHGVPVVTTTVGAEGVGPDRLFAAMGDTVDRLAEGLVMVLNDPQGAVPTSSAAQRWATKEFSRERFRHDLSDIWRRARLSASDESAIADDVRNFTPHVARVEAFLYEATAASAERPASVLVAEQLSEQVAPSRYVTRWYEHARLGRQ